MRNVPFIVSLVHRDWYDLFVRLVYPSSCVDISINNTCTTSMCTIVDTVRTFVEFKKRIALRESAIVVCVTHRRVPHSLTQSSRAGCG